MASILFSLLLSLLSHLKTLPTKCLERLRSPTKTRPNTTVPSKKTFLAAGKSGVVYGIGPERVLKEFHDKDASGIEHRVYQRLGTHPNIAKVLEIQPNGSIILERGTPLRKICRASPAYKVPIQTKVRWLIHAAEGYKYLHNRNIIHGDVGCHNWILIGEDCVKLIDFEGCSIDGEPAGSCYEWFSYRPSMPRVSQRTDIFAFGCAIYEILTGKPPYHELETSDDPYGEVEKLYETHRFPDVTGLPLGQLIQSCWYGDANSMSDVIQKLEAIRTEPLR